MLMASDDFDHHVHDAMSRTALTKFDGSDTQYVLDSQRRLFFLMVFLLSLLQISQPPRPY